MYTLFKYRCENSIKNRFYSRLRKSVRKLNKAIGGKDLKRYNKFKLNIIFKLSNISEGKMAQKHKFAPQIFQFYRGKLFSYQRILIQANRIFQLRLEINSYKIIDYKYRRCRESYPSPCSFRESFQACSRRKSCQGKKEKYRLPETIQL